jgi:protein-S-isoprenylcysteine O-methyltransferase Ste14
LILNTARRCLTSPSRYELSTRAPGRGRNEIVVQVPCRAPHDCRISTPIRWADERIRAMKTKMSRTTQEALGCFLMLVLGAIMSLGVMSIAMLAISERQRVDQPKWWRSILLWVIAPGAGFAFVAWLTYGFNTLRSRKQRR